MLDEGDDARVQALCTASAPATGRKLWPATGQGLFKALQHGNYNAWLAEHGFAHYDLIMNIDPDHVPASTFLRGAGLLRRPDDRLCAGGAGL